LRCEQIVRNNFFFRAKSTPTMGLDKVEKNLCKSVLIHSLQTDKFTIIGVPQDGVPIGATIRRNPRGRPVSIEPAALLPSGSRAGLSRKDNWCRPNQQESMDAGRVHG